MLYFLWQFYTRMKIAIIAATNLELEGLQKSALKSQHDLVFYTHGVGIFQSMYHIQKLANTKPDLIIQCGIAGSYNNSIHIGETVLVYSECFGDCGSETQDEILDLIDLNFLDPQSFPFVNGLLVNPSVLKIDHLKRVAGLTVNLSSGKESTIRQRKIKYQPEIETMEGACLHYICLQEKISFLQFRGISNYVEPRDKSKWKIKDALQSCHTEVIQFIQQLK